MLIAKLGHFLDKPLAPIAKKITINPNILTLLGFFITIFAAITIPFNLFIGGLLILFGSLFDMLDGIVARNNGRATKFGALLDSVLDRYSDSFLFIAVAVYFFNNNNLSAVIFSIGSLVGALLISYVRARAEGIGIECNVGIMERPERIVLLSFGCISGWLLYSIFILFVLTHITAIHRILHVYRITRSNS